MTGELAMLYPFSLGVFAALVIFFFFFSFAYMLQLNISATFSRRNSGSAVKTTPCEFHFNKSIETVSAS